MTDEQFNQVVQALNQGNWQLLCLLIIVVVAWIIAMGFQLWITKRIEAAVENKQYFSRLRYEKEIELYREIWILVHQFYSKSALAFAWKVSGNQVSEISEMPTQESWQKSQELLSQTIERNKPFYPNEIWMELSEFETLCFTLSWLSGNYYFSCREALCAKTNKSAI
jgi:hypothetical protein